MLPDWKALSLDNTRKAYWHMAGDPLNIVLPNAYLANFGLMSLAIVIVEPVLLCELRYTDSTRSNS